MSKTACLYAEIWKNSQWEAIPCPKFSKGIQVPVRCMSLGTPYELYAALVGYEHRTTYPIWHTEQIVPLSEPRGFPEDMNATYKNYFDGPRWKNYLTWFLVQEVIDYDWDREFSPFTSYVKGEYESLFSKSNFFPKDFPENEGIYGHMGEGRVKVSWVENFGSPRIAVVGSRYSVDAVAVKLRG
jgi:hypothetical protein